MKPTYRAAVMSAPHAPIEIREFPAPELAPGGVLLHTLLSEVCGTDVHLWHGRLAGVPYPIIPGHVSVGVVAALHGSVQDVDGVPFREGDVAAFLDVHETCGACHACLVTKQTTRCPHRKVYGITYSADEGLLGGWSEAIWLKPGVKLLRLPAGLDPETYCGGGCGLSTALHAIDRAEIRLGDSVVVLGVGPVGQSIVAFAGISGAGELVAVGAPADRLEFARRMGATATVGLDASEAERRALILAHTGGRGADVVIEAAGAPEAVRQALDLVRDGGRVVVCGQYTDCGPVELNPHTQINRKHVEIRGCWGSDFSHFYRALAVMARHHERLPWREMISARFGLDECNEGLAAMQERRVLKAAVVPSPGA
jgi:D-arabinose 1-dehydrogenase-like Zn-dependent alcohol dehydrogenase